MEATFYTDVAFGLGFLAGYLFHRRRKLSPREFEYQLARLNGAELTAVTASLQKAWQIPDEFLRFGPPKQDGSEEKSPPPDGKDH